MEENFLLTSDGQKLYSLSDLYFWILISDEKLVKENLERIKNWIKNLNEDLANNIKNLEDKEDILYTLKKYLFRKKDKEEKVDGLFLLPSIIE